MMPLSQLQKGAPLQANCKKCSYWVDKLQNSPLPLGSPMPGHMAWEAQSVGRILSFPLFSWCRAQITQIYAVVLVPNFATTISETTLYLDPKCTLS